MAENTVIKFDRLLKNAEHGYSLKKYLSSETGRGLFNISKLTITSLKVRKSLVSNFVPLSRFPLQLSFYIKYKRNRFLLESFIELGFNGLPACK